MPVGLITWKLRMRPNSSLTAAYAPCVMTPFTSPRCSTNLIPSNFLMQLPTSNLYAWIGHISKSREISYSVVGTCILLLVNTQCCVILQVETLPVFGVGHSLGALTHLLIGEFSVVVSCKQCHLDGSSSFLVGWESNQSLLHLCFCMLIGMPKSPGRL